MSDSYERALKKLERAKFSHENGVMMEYEVKTSNDERVCDVCMKHEGYKGSVLDAKIGINHPPFHDGCRCRASYRVVGIKSKK